MLIASGSVVAINVGGVQGEGVIDGYCYTPVDENEVLFYCVQVTPEMAKKLEGEAIIDESEGQFTLWVNDYEIESVLVG